jgi:hypothetical protein
MQTKTTDLNALQEANDCMVMSEYQLRKEQLLCIVKSVLKGIASSVAGVQIEHFSFKCCDVLIVNTFLKLRQVMAVIYRWVARIHCWYLSWSRVLPGNKRTRGPLAHEFASDSSKNKVTE